MVVRERIRHDERVTPCIYHGLPLRSEFRVFYDFDLKKVLFTANYWDYDSVYGRLYDATDKIIFDHERERLESTFKEKKKTRRRRWLPNTWPMWKVSLAPGQSTL